MELHKRMQRSPGKSLLGNLKDACGIKLRCPEMNEASVAPEKHAHQYQPEKDTLLGDDPALPAGSEKEPVKWEEADIMPLHAMFGDPKIKDLWEEAPSTQKAEKKRLFGDCSSDDEDFLYDPEATVVLGDPVPETPKKKKPAKMTCN